MHDATPVVEPEAPEQDTATSPTPNEADVQVNNDAPEASQSQEETTDLTAEETAEAKLYAGKYKTVEDMEKAYTELQSKATKDSQEKAELSRILNEAFTPPSQDDNESYNDVPDEREDARDRDIALLKFSIAHENANGEEMAKVLQSDPFINSISSYEAKLEYAYLKSQNMSSKQAMVEAEKKAAQETQAKFAEKQAAQVETAKTQAPPANNKVELTPDMIRTAAKSDKAFDDLISQRFPGINKMRTRR